MSEVTGRKRSRSEVTSPLSDTPMTTKVKMGLGVEEGALLTAKQKAAILPTINEIVLREAIERHTERTKAGGAFEANPSIQDNVAKAAQTLKQEIPDFTTSTEVSELQAALKKAQAEIKGLRQDNSTMALDFDDIMKASDREGVRGVIKEVRSKGMVVRVSHGTSFALNLILHVALLFAALTLLYDLMVAKDEQNALQGQFTRYSSTNLLASLKAADAREDGVIKESFAAALPVMKMIRKGIPESDQATTNWNRYIISIAYFITAAIFLLFITIVVALWWGAGVPVARTVCTAIVYQFILMLFIGGAEAAFFLLVGKKRVPEPPSSIVRNLLTSLKTSTARVVAGDRLAWH